MESRETSEPLDVQMARMEGDRDTLESERMRLELRTRLFGEAAVPTRVDRFIVLRRIGAGGMGVVYAAYDPQLERNVALKLVRTPDPETWASYQQRLLHEARALARLSHPNVIAVFEAGTHGRGVFIAMELVEGSTLDAYCRAPERSQRELVSAYLQASEGLAAAHEAGLVHRDFKPQNVLVGTDGRVRVLDFGLARVTGDTERDDAASAPNAVTGAGGLLGTPAYMAPEQRSGEPATSASDQFAFCAALHEALVGSLPRVDLGRDVVELARRGLPRRLRSVLARGLAVDPARRWPSMRALLRELRRAAGRRRSFIAGVLACAAALAIATSTLLRDDACPDARAQLDGVWDEARAAQVGAVTNWDDGELARETARLTVEHLGAYAERWVDATAQACRAHNVDKTESAALFDAKMLCLARRRSSLAALVDVLLDADEATSRKAVEASVALPRVVDCLDAERLLARVAPPDDPATAESVERLRAELDRARVQFDLGRATEATAITASVLDEANELGYRPLQAEAAYLRAGYLGIIGDEEAAAAGMQDAAWYAEAGGDDAVLADALANLVSLETRRGAHDRAHEIARRTDATIERISFRSLAEWTLHHARAELARSEDRFADAVVHCEAQLQWARDVDPGSLHEVEAKSHVAIAVYDAGDYARAGELLQAAAEQQRQWLGELHPYVLRTRGNLAAALERQGRNEEAIALLEDVVAGYQRSGREQGLANPLLLLGQLEALRGRFEQAMAHNERAVEVAAATDGPNSPLMIAAEQALGAVYTLADRRGDARAAFGRAMRLAEATGRRHGWALALAHIAELDRLDGVPERAAPALREAIAALSEVHGPEHPLVGEINVMLADAEFDLGHLDAAQASIERAIEILAADGLQTRALAEAHERRAAVVAAQRVPKER